MRLFSIGLASFRRNSSTSRLVSRSIPESPFAERGYGGRRFWFALEIDIFGAARL
jgi:hypothetical protein